MMDDKDSGHRIGDLEVQGIFFFMGRWFTLQNLPLLYVRKYRSY